MSLPTLAELPGILLPLVTRAEQSLRTAVAALEDDHRLSTWTPERWAQFARVVAASDFVIEQSVRDPLMLLGLVESGELDRGFAPGELCGQIAAAVNAAQTEDELGRALRRQRTRQQVRIIWRDLTRQADLVQTCRDLRTWPMRVSIRPISGCIRVISSSLVCRPAAAVASRNKWSSSAWANSARWS